MIILIVLFALSLICPIYTYALYPIFLRMMMEKDYKCSDAAYAVTVIVVGNNADDKIKSVERCSYPLYEVVVGNYSDADKAKGEIVVFTDTKTELDLHAIKEIVKPFSDARIGAVIGQQTNPEGNSAFWRYENLIKKLESRMGCVSGANEGLFAVRRSDVPIIPRRVLNKPFYIATKIANAGKAVVFQESAKAYEGKTDGTNFKKHVEDAAGYWQALRLFSKMLLPSHGSFVYISHRVMKWFVWLDMVLMLVTSGLMAVKGSFIMAVVFGIQIIGYVMIVALAKTNIGGPAGKLINILFYFLMLNAAYFAGLFKMQRSNE